MTKDELSKKVFNFWLYWGIPEYEKSDADLQQEILYNLEHDIDKEIDYIRLELENCDPNTPNYEYLEEIWNDLNYYKGGK